jgi:hypothetical protein
LRTFVRFVASGLCLLGLGGVAQAQSAREFWQSEWQRQPQRDASLGGSGWGRPTYQQPQEWFGGQQPSGYSRLPERQTPQARSRESRPERRKMPTVRVTNPTFLTYAPDKLTNVALRAVCKLNTASNAPAVDQDTTGSASAGATVPAPAATADSLFVQACAEWGMLSSVITPRTRNFSGRSKAA